MPFYASAAFAVVLTASGAQGFSALCTKDSPSSCCSTPLNVLVALIAIDFLMMAVLTPTKGLFLVRFEAAIFVTSITLNAVASRDRRPLLRVPHRVRLSV